MAGTVRHHGDSPWTAVYGTVLHCTLVTHDAGRFCRSSPPISRIARQVGFWISETHGHPCRHGANLMRFTMVSRRNAL